MPKTLPATSGWRPSWKVWTSSASAVRTCQLKLPGATTSWVSQAAEASTTTSSFRGSTTRRRVASGKAERINRVHTSSTANLRSATASKSRSSKVPMAPTRVRSSARFSRRAATFSSTARTPRWRPLVGKSESAMHPPGKLRSTVLPPWVWSSSWSVMVGPAGSGDLTQHGRDSSWCTRDTHSQLPVKPRDAGISSRTRMSSRPAAAAGLRDVRYTSDRQSCVSADARTLATPNQPL
ncbi:Uncharacterised protein [Mycobacterium tuberculosis]|nr:Uncharacterised protein [Mycobacterium tuberculosis]